MMVAAMAHDVDFQFTCISLEKTSSKVETTDVHPHDIIFWWLQTNQTTPAQSQTGLEAPFYPQIPSTSQACRGVGRASLEYATPAVSESAMESSTLVLKI